MFTKRLRKRLTAKKEEFAGMGDTIQTEHGPLTYIDRGGDILAVAHLDWVLFNENPKITKQFENVRIEECPQLDDRLGAWMCLDVLPEAGITCDVLLTDSEESGNSTAQFFQAPKDYNFMIQFDRAGSDAVMYEYEDQFCHDILTECGYEVGYGSFTDICYLSHLGCKGFNFGVGYHDQHSDGCHANLAETFNSFSKVQSMIAEWGGERFPHEHITTKRKKRKKKRSTNWWTQPYWKWDLYVELSVESVHENEGDLDRVAQEYFGSSYWWLSSKDKDRCHEILDELEWGNPGQKIF